MVGKKFVLAVGSDQYCSILAISVVLTICSRMNSAAAAPVTVAMIQKAWEDRQSRVKSARVTWVARQTDTKGSLSLLMGKRGNPHGKTIPPQDTSFDVPSSLFLDGEKVKYRRHEQQWSHKQGGYRRAEYISVFDGIGGKALWQYGTGKKDHPTGSVRHEVYFLDAAAPDLRPLLMTYRALTPTLRCCDIREYSLTGRRAMVSGRSCLELQRQARGGETVERLWIDPGRDYLVLRYTVIRKERVEHKIDVRFRRGSSETGWLPQGWDIVTLSQAGQVLYSSRATVTDIQINSGINDAEFGLDFPPGSLIGDLKASQWYWVKPNGDKRIIQKGERALTYEQLLNSEPDNAQPQPFYRTWLGILLMAGASIALILLLGRIWFRRKHSLSGAG